MSSHDDPIGQEWTSPQWDARDFHDLIHRVLDGHRDDDYVVLGYLAASAPAKLREALLSIEHGQGRHSEGKCPEHCPRY